LLGALLFRPQPHPKTILFLFIFRQRCLGGGAQKNKGADLVQIGGGVRSIKHSKFKRIAKFGLIVAVETAAFTVAENQMSDFLGMARISAAFGKYSGCNYAVSNTWLVVINFRWIYPRGTTYSASAQSR
jgi:hypothetical protein